MSDINTNYENSLPMVRGRDDRFRGALVRKTVHQTINDNSNTSVAFQLEEYDTDNFHDNVTANPRFTIPAGSGITRIKLSTSIRWAPNAVGDRHVEFFKNNVGFIGQGRVRYTTAIGNTGQALVSAVVDCIEGDYFNVRVIQTSGVSIQVLFNSGQGTWFCIQVMEYDHD